VFPLCSEITEAGKKIEDVIEIVYAKRQPHIVLKKLEMIIFQLFCDCNAVWG